MVQFNEDNSSDIVAERLLRDGSRLAACLALFVRHLHGAVRETRPTPADWRQAIRFLTDVGHASDERRQEWILLSDLLGVTALIEEINAQRPKGATPNTPRGPFYRAAAPRYPAGASISLDGLGEPLAVSGRVVGPRRAADPGRDGRDLAGQCRGTLREPAARPAAGFQSPGRLRRRRGRRLPLPDRQAGGLRGAGRRSGRPAPPQHRLSAPPAGASPVHDQRPRLRDAHHPRL